MIAVITLGIYFVGQSADPVQAVAAPVAAVAGYVALATLIATGVVPDRGLIASAGAPPSALVFSIAAGAGVLSFAAYLARKSRASMRAAIERSNEAMRSRAGEALLVEAQQQLERALGIAVGKAGHYTGQLAGRIGSTSSSASARWARCMQPSTSRPRSPPR